MTLFPIVSVSAGFPVSSTASDGGMDISELEKIYIPLDPPWVSQDGEMAINMGDAVPGRLYIQTGLGASIKSDLLLGYGVGNAANLQTRSGSGLTFDWTGSGLGFYINGTGVAGIPAGLSKSFVIAHPTDADRLLVHACLEGPEAAVFYRGEATLDDAGRATVELPAYFAALTRPESATVQVSVVLDGEDDVFGAVAATRVRHRHFVIRGLAGQHVAWRVEAERRDVAPLVVEPLRSEVAVHGDGPYRWVQDR